MTAFEHWLLSQTTDVDTLAGLLFMEIYENDNPQVWEMLKQETGRLNMEAPDKITRETFTNIAKQLIEKSHAHNHH
jgi:hypothetical protein